MSETYLGDRITWKIERVEDLARYQRVRLGANGLLKRYVVYPVFIFACVALIWGTFGDEEWGFGLVALSLYGGWLFIDRLKVVARVTLALHPGWLMLTESYKGWWLDKTIALLPRLSVKSMQWVAGGCYIEVRHFSTGFTTLIDIGLFQDQSSVDALERWAEVHGLQIEGVPPLPGAYVRSVSDSSRA